MAGIIGIIQVKGGVGRSTIATNLAAHLATEAPTALVDCDLPQGTSASWYALRRQSALVAGLTLATAANPAELVTVCSRLVAGHTYLVIDAPPRLAEMTRAIIVMSRLCLIPLGASAAEIWSTADLMKTIAEAKQFRPNVDARLVWNRFRSYTREAQELSISVGKELGLPELATKIGYRVSYSEALARGLTVREWPDRAARDEMAHLVDEVRTIMEEETP